MRRRAVAAILAAGLAGAVHAVPSALETARIERLIAYVGAQRKLSFVRNGDAYSAREAATFLRQKFERMGEHVGTAAQFIDQIGSRSSTTGEPYLIRFADGRTMTAAQFLGEELRRMDRQP